MIYHFHTEAGAPTVLLIDEDFRHLIKVRRSSVDDTLTLRNKTLQQSYTYRIDSVGKHSATATLVEALPQLHIPSQSLHIAWCIIEAKNIEKVLPSLVEIGVSSITFLACDRSQRNFRMELSRWERIVDSALQQSGRTHPMELLLGKDVETFLNQYPETTILDFAPTPLELGELYEIERLLIGCEGGFSPKEQKLFDASRVRKLATPHILRSETAVVAAASLVLLSKF